MRSPEDHAFKGSTYRFDGQEMRPAHKSKSYSRRSKVHMYSPFTDVGKIIDVSQINNSVSWYQVIGDMRLWNKRGGQLQGLLISDRLLANTE